MAKPIRDIVGQRFGRLTVISFAGRGCDGRGRWLCQCDCGNQKIVSNSNLGRGVVSCGCKRKEDLAKNGFRLKHGQSRSRLYGVWGAMVDRCENPNAHEYENYGGRGIKICDEWRTNFEAFAEWAYANGYDEKAKRRESTLDRIDVDGDYEPSNCRFASAKEQNRNRRSNVMITYNGETHCMSEWAEIAGIPYGTFQHRLYKGWSVEDAIGRPLVYSR